MTTDLNQPALRQWLVEPLPLDVAQSVQRIAAAFDVQHVAVMPDVHLSGDVCVGLAVATHCTLYPQAVGGDIGCGMAALQFHALADVLSNERAAARLLSALYRRVPAIKHARETAPADLPPDLQQTALSHPRLEKLKQREGRLQFGTLGRGNHFLEFQSDRIGQLWLMVHSGSRGIGQAITAHHLAIGVGNRATKSIMGIEADSPQGQAYLSDVAWAVRYAEQNRRAIIAAVEHVLADLLGIEAIQDSLIHCNHNHVRQELHFAKTLWVHRKGALPAAVGEPGIIPGSMGTRSFHVSGRGNELSLNSSSHGAGRALSRGLASRMIGIHQLQREMRGVWFDHRHAVRLVDEAPSAYKDIGAVMRAQRELTRIDRELQPLLSYKG